VDGLTFVASATFILFIVPPPRRVIGSGGAPKKSGLLDGWSYCRRHRRVIELIGFTVLFWSAAGVVRSTIPALVGHVFEGTIKEIGYFTATLGVGMLAGALILAYFGDALRSEIAISWSLKGAGASVLWLAVVFMALPYRVAGGVGLFLTGMFGSGVLVGANALLQKVVPDFFRGRVFGFKDVASVGGLLLATGALAIPEWPHVDRYVPVLLIGVGVMLVVSGVTATIVRLRRGRFSLAINFWKNLNEFYCRAWARVRRVGPCTIPPSGPVIVAANHRSALDPFVLIATSPNRFLSFMIAREFAEIPLFGRLVRMIECVAVNRTGVDTASVKASLRHLSNGRCLGIFPEGRIRLEGELLKVHEGVALLALRGGATVVPAYITGLHPSRSIYRAFFRRHQAVVRYGPPIDLARWRGREKDRAAYREAAEHIMEAINAMKP
jgi:1-acyl-sn-glycerol-3-phosphate acyltransferase